MTAVEKFWQDVQDVLPPSSVGYETATKLGIAYEQAKEMEKEQNNAKIQKAIELFEEAKRQADIAKDVIYLDGVLAVLDGIKNTKL